MRKRRSDAVLFNLPEATQAEIHRLDVEEHLKLAEIQARLAMPEDEGGLGVGHVSQGALSEFLRDWRSRAWRNKIREAATTAKEVVDDELAESGEAMDEAILAGVREWIMDGLSRGALGPKDAKSLVGLVLKGRQQAIDARKLELLERKARQAEEAEGALNDESLTEAEKQQRIRGIFGIGG